MAKDKKPKFVEWCKCEHPIASTTVMAEPPCQHCGLNVRRRPKPGPNGRPIQAQAPHANGTARPPELDRPAAQAGRDTARLGRIQAIADIRAQLDDPLVSEGARRSLEFSLDRYAGLEAAETSPPPEPRQIAPGGRPRTPPPPFTIADARKALSPPQTGATS